MLQQILQTMTVDPDLLAELSDEQKAILFVKIREEQVRRYNDFEKKNQDDRIPRKPKKAGRKNVDFLAGRDGREWVWVMGEHKNDKSIEEMIEIEIQERALKLAEKEIEEIRRKEEAELARKLEEEKERFEDEQKHKEDELRKQREEAELYASLKQAREAARKLEAEKQKAEEEEKIRVEQLRQKASRSCRELDDMEHRFAEDKRRSLERLVKDKNRRSSEIFSEFMCKREEMEKIAEQNIKEVETSWQEQERKAKKAEEEVKELARRARIEYKNSLRQSANIISAVSAFSGNGTNQKPPVPPKSAELKKSMANVVKKRPPRPPNKQAVVEWFLEEERPKGVGTDPRTGKVAVWFHGVISRLEAENYLLNMTLGSYLVRVSERVWGYTISYRAEDRCKHFLVDTSDQGYQFFGANQVVHRSLTDLVNFHKSNPITVTGGELLRSPVGQIKDPPDYHDLMRPRITESTAL
ncbi:SH2 domain-containing protein 4B-like isoform X3 [Crassostrea virginica]|uniref:SH2 domain-containing protein 4B-like isoform X1 n=1 Tax=Crassostrea virginica TaxID=6565 RepID=A0A8B8CQ16_CRAVI|nr:SH2 domain-containing protein 4B-like isoform X1 [Crassostrea virginica]XP_022317897.1 SH2 domain-containing protein 4B-like isoform X1 [Crassostrea virginica]XP_022317899.1 SH2 domain-containing protein 4B-like isoform X1 [Crassostrea virginica]XP_022317900.1 SH2 domain-containing protein 4B-like isoform X1 [Crassostrea virginica]